jgi:serine/threonine-protein kinase
MENDKYIGKMLDNRYEIQERIGVGGMAIVYRALCHRLNRYVAVKVLKDDYAVDEDFRRRFHTEAQAVAMLSHPNIVTVYDVSRTQDVNYIVMELIEGMTLKQYMQKRGQLSWKEALHFSMQISKALIHAHSRGIIHRDIKPHNIMILKDGSVKVADFGIARLSSTQNTLTQQTLGSVHYISPEQAKGSSIDARTDIYSLGVVMYEMLTGRLPFEGENAVSIAIQHISSIPLMPREINPDIPVGLEAITMKAMNPDLDKRYQFAEQLYDDLETFRKNPDVDFSEQDLQFQPEERGKKEPKNPDTRQATESPGSMLPPVSRRGELSRAEYRDNSRRARTVSILSGVFLVIVFILGVFLYLWHSWFNEMFSEPPQIPVPGLVEMKLEDILANPMYTDDFNIIPTYESSETVAEGVVMSQNPPAGRNVIKSEKKKADIKLIVSSGTTVIILPETINSDYRDAIIQLNKLGLNHEESFVKSEDVTEGYVISMIPAAGAEMKAGDTVFLEISTGPEIKFATMPDLVGDTISTAQAKLEGSNLVMGNITERPDDAPAGVVTWQSRTAGESVQEKTKINLIISSGPAETPPPAEEEAPPEQQSGETQNEQPPQEGDGSVG